MSAKLVTLSVLKIKIFWNSDYGVIISAHDVTNKILLRDSIYIADVAMWSKFDKSKFLWEKFSWPQFHKDFTGKNHFFLRVALGSSSII